jgi:hypothetical protein
MQIAVLGIEAITGYHPRPNRCAPRRRQHHEHQLHNVEQSLFLPRLPDRQDVIIAYPLESFDPDQ